MSGWFYTREIARDTWLIAEPGHVNSWLVAGAERAILVDTGLGIAPIRPVVERLTPVSVSVVNTHHHFDHVGGNHEFDEIAIHPLGAPLLASPVPPEVTQGYARYAAAVAAAYGDIEAVDRGLLHLSTEEARPRPLPSGFAPETWRIEPTTATSTLSEGDRIELGGRTLEVLHCPGHSEDGIALLDRAAGLLVAGDTISTGPIYAQFPESDLESLAGSVRRLASLEHELRNVLVGHFGRTTVEPGFLREVARGFEEVCAGSRSSSPAADCLGDRVREVRFDRFSIYLPDGGRRRTLVATSEEVPG